MIAFAKLGLIAAATLAVALPASAQTLEQMAGQMVLVGFEGDAASDSSVQALSSEIAAGRLGGVMYLKRNVASLDAVAEMNAAFRSSASPVPFITLDQEGGAVERLTEDVGFREIPNARSVAQSRTPAEAQSLYADMAEQIAAVGFNVNFGPVADLDLNPDNQIIARYGRAFAADAETVTAYNAAFINAHHAAGILTALKHFPGHGSSTADSHEGFVDITDSWQEAELEPYRQLISAGYNDFVMIGHLYHEEYSGGVSGLPSSLSPVWITDVLRDQLGFDGVVISDDLEMGAIREHFSLENTVIQAVRAGMDVLLFSNTAAYDPNLAARVRGILLDEAERDPAFANRIRESYQRITALKSMLG
ncbi:hypothetical protein GCM10007989_07110 [Devosia pacifica]|uniref:beta-N-acetylhexosaminidase n=1 Tax=Devosia pacifica TaxID=1335967 RepID=A0A918RZ72_9HYPH|nr:glycoside hydrolase family 3 protein [Devosia pacifica]GHA14961.1 hypothetical protein GCM10007989_07110 [Devosia pacifica]